MIELLKINNIAIIEKTDVNFEIGLNILTGETGAGKSIIIDSIYAIMGERTPKSLIRSNCTDASVYAVFSNLSSDIKAFLLENDISDDNGTYIIERKLSVNNKNICKINGVPVNTFFLKEIGKRLINIHGQHDNQLLLNPDNHINYLDLYSDNFALLENYRRIFTDFKKCRKKLKNILKNEEDYLKKKELLEYQINEIESLNLSENEIDELKDKINLLENNEKINKIIKNLSMLFKGDNNFSILLNDYLSQIIKLQVSNKNLDKCKDLLSDSIDDIAELKDILDAILNEINYNEDSLNELKQRLSYINKIYNKYNVNNYDSLILLLNNFKNELKIIDTDFSEKAVLEEKLLNIQNDLIRLSSDLTKSRKENAAKLSAEICKVLAYLEMPNIEFVIDISEAKYSELGRDNVEFLISANKGQKIKPLSKVASGGELSRIMLAIKSILASKDQIDTLIFDEIDTGISGETANKIALQLRELSKIRQVICITHLPQIAAVADNHIKIEKETIDNNTFTKVKKLYDSEVIKEIARIMYGNDIDDKSYYSAENLYKNIRKE